MLRVVASTPPVLAYPRHFSTHHQQEVYRQSKSQRPVTLQKFLRTHDPCGLIDRITKSLPTRAVNCEYRGFYRAEMKGGQSQDLRATYQEFMGKQRRGKPRPRRHGVTAQAREEDSSESKGLGEWRDGGGGEMPKGLWDALVAVNESSKWLASFASLLTVLFLLPSQHNRAAAWFAIGAVGNAACGKLLKKLLNQQRPGTAAGIKDDPGMPSSHGLSLAFLSTYASLAVMDGWGPSPSASAAAASLLCLGVILSWLRIIVGYHTPAQVGVGFAMGFVFANAWHGLWPLLTTSPWALRYSLVLDAFLAGGAAVVAIVAAFIVLPAWLKQARRR